MASTQEYIDSEENLQESDNLILPDRRPPLYNPEDYVRGLTKFSQLDGLQMYLGDIDTFPPDIDNSNKKILRKPRNNHGKQPQVSLSNYPFDHDVLVTLTTNIKKFDGAMIIVSGHTKALLKRPVL